MGIRTIIFRGKKENGEWVYGDLIQLHEEAPYWYILPEGISSEIYEDEPYLFRQNDVMCRVALAKVIPETIGQFTGLTDKNGKKIFEGDIVKWDEKVWGRPYNELVEFDYKLLEMREHDYKQWCEVIGNIHDQDIEELKNGQ